MRIALTSVPCSMIPAEYFLTKLYKNPAFLFAIRICPFISLFTDDSISTYSHIQRVMATEIVLNIKFETMAIASFSFFFKHHMLVANRQNEAAKDT